MSKLPVIKDHELLALLLRAGFIVARWGGTSHAQLVHPDKPDVRITLAIHHRDMHRSELRKTLKSADHHRRVPQASIVLPLDLAGRAFP